MATGRKDFWKSCVLRRRLEWKEWTNDVEGESGEDDWLYDQLITV